jgi:hypothetical protein
MDEKTIFRVPAEAHLDNKNPVDIAAEETSTGTSQLIYVDPKKEAAAFRKFDKFVLPVSVIFLVLSSLDRNNVSDTLVR